MDLKRIERPRGTRDFLPEDMEKRRELENTIRSIVESFGYREIQTPTFEHLELFTIKSGEEIVKEMYSFKDKSGRDLALRPELTAPVMRLLVNECSHLPKPIRFYYFSNCFRYERPQRGRYREFWQFGVELIGSDSYLADAEVIYLAYKILKSLNINFELRVGHVGLLRFILRDLDETHTSRVMRLIDKKDIKGLIEFFENIKVNKETKEILLSIVEKSGRSDILDDVKSIVSDFNFGHIEKVCEILDNLEVDYKLDFGIARGLDYYTGIVFEAYAEGLGAQNQVCGGGSYRLAHLFGGEDIPCTGFALGFDRLMEIYECKPRGKIKIVVVDLGYKSDALKVAEIIRDSVKGVSVITDTMERSVKKQLSYANDIKADFALFVGKKELETGKFSFKNLKTGEQFELSLDDIINKIKMYTQQKA